MADYRGQIAEDRLQRADNNKRKTKRQKLKDKS